MGSRRFVVRPDAMASSTASVEAIAVAQIARQFGGETGCRFITADDGAVAGEHDCFAAQRFGDLGAFLAGLFGGAATFVAVSSCGLDTGPENECCRICITCGGTGDHGRGLVEPA